MNDAIRFLIILGLVIFARLLLRWLSRIWKDDK